MSSICIILFGNFLFHLIIRFTSEQFFFPMKTTLISIAFLISCAQMLASNVTDTLFLNNGSVIICSVEDYAPAGEIRVRTSDGSLFVYNSEEILRFAKEIESTKQKLSQNAKINAYGIFLYQNGKRLTKYDDIPSILGENLTIKYTTAQSLYRSSFVLGSIGIFNMLASFIPNRLQNQSDKGSESYQKLGTMKHLLLWGGLGIAATGIAFQFVSYGIAKKVAEEYNLQNSNLALSITPLISPTINSESNICMTPGISITYSF